MKAFLFIALALLCAGCSRDASLPPGVLEREAFLNAYVALVANEQAAAGQKEFHLSKFEPDSALAAIGVTREQILATLEYYQRDPDRWQEFYVEAVKRLQEKKDNQAQR